MALDQIQNFVRGELSESIDSEQTTIDVEDGSIFPSPPNEYNLVIYDAGNFSRASKDPNVEIVRVTDVTDNTLTVERGQEETDASSHPGSAEAFLSITSKMFTDIDQRFDEVSGGEPVGLDSAEFDAFLQDQESANEMASAPVTMGAVVVSAPAIDAVATSTTAMDAVSASETGRGAVRDSDLAFDTVTGSNMAIGKFAVGEAGFDPTDFADMDAVAASEQAMDAVAASETAMDVVIASELALDKVVASETAMDAVAASELAMDVVAASETARDAVIASETAMNEVAASEVATEAVVASAFSQYLSTQFTESIWQQDAIYSVGENEFIIDEDGPEFGFTIDLTDIDTLSFEAFNNNTLDELGVRIDGDQVLDTDSSSRDSYDSFNVDVSTEGPDTEVLFTHDGTANRGGVVEFGNEHGGKLCVRNSRPDENRHTHYTNIQLT